MMIARSKLLLLLCAILVLGVYSSPLTSKRLRKLKMPTDLSQDDFQINATSQTCSVSSNANLVHSVLSWRGGAFVDRMPAISLSLGQVKLLLQLALTSFNVICWSLPLTNSKLKENRRVLSLANCFAGGIFLMLSFGHLIPQAISSLSDGQDKGFRALLYVVGGFLAMLFVEKVAFNHDSESNEFPETRPKSGFHLNSAIVLCLAMSIHSFFESAALGLANNLSAATLMSACIALHQPAESLALVVAFLKTDMKKRNIVAWLSGFSLVALLGNLCGNLITTRASESLEAIIVALTAGTFVYVGATEIVSEEFEDHNWGNRFVNFVMYVLGMVTMFVITSVVDKWESVV